jgi:hypothetical protein
MPPEPDPARLRLPERWAARLTEQARAKCEYQVLAIELAARVRSDGEMLLPIVERNQRRAAYAADRFERATTDAARAFWAHAARAFYETAKVHSDQIDFERQYRPLLRERDEAELRLRRLIGDQAFEAYKVEVEALLARPETFEVGTSIPWAHEQEIPTFRGALRAADLAEDLVLEAAEFSAEPHARETRARRHAAKAGSNRGEPHPKPDRLRHIRHALSAVVVAREAIGDGDLALAAEVLYDLELDLASALEWEADA